MNGYREFESVAELRAHYAALRLRTFPRSPKEKPHVERDWLLLSEPQAAPAPSQIQDYVGLSTQIRDAILRVTQLKLSEFVSPRRFDTYVIARQVFYYFCKTYTSRSYPEIGRLSGGRDHTTVIHGYRKIESLIERGCKKTIDLIVRVEAELADVLNREVRGV